MYIVFACLEVCCLMVTCRFHTRYFGSSVLSVVSGLQTISTRKVENMSDPLPALDSLPEDLVAQWRAIAYEYCGSSSLSPPLSPRLRE